MIWVVAGTVVCSAQLTQAATRRRLRGGPCVRRRFPERVTAVVAGFRCAFCACPRRDGRILTGISPGFLCFPCNSVANTQRRNLPGENEERGHLGVLLVQDVGPPEVRVHCLRPLRFPLASHLLFSLSLAHRRNLTLCHRGHNVRIIVQPWGFAFGRGIAAVVNPLVFDAGTAAIGGCVR